MSNKLLIPCLYLKESIAVQGFNDQSVEASELANPVELAKFFSNRGADELLVYDLSTTDASHDVAIAKIKEIAEAAEVPVIGAGNVRRMEDVKKLLYAGCQKAVLNFSKDSNIELLSEVSKKFGKAKIAVCILKLSQFTANRSALERYADCILCTDSLLEEIQRSWTGRILLHSGQTEKEFVIRSLQNIAVSAITGSYVSDRSANLMELKKDCKDLNIQVNTFQSAIDWSDFKVNADGMVPVIVQDYKTNEVLMLAYMNEPSFNTTLETGMMTYWSRSRDELWTKGLTSGHVQYVKSLALDCDHDTILAKVSQVGAACHTGNRTCFFQELVKKEYNDTNPLTVFQQVFDVIQDRKANPKEGSYTNYLFDKGIDKILKKVGEECTELVIAAKNPDKEEIKYEISDFLYHMMVLMAEKEVGWEEITRELARR